MTVRLAITALVLSLLPGCATGIAPTRTGAQPAGRSAGEGTPPASLASAKEGSNVDLPRYPSISPDGSRIIFSWRGDLFSVSAAGGSAARLTSHPGLDLYSAWHRNGNLIAFSSARNGFLNLYTMQPDGTDLRQVTNTDRPCVLSGFGVDDDGRDVLLFHSRREGDNYREERPYMIGLQGGDMTRVHDAFGAEAVVSPNGRYVAFTRGGGRWSRKGYRGADRRNVFLFDRETNTFRQLTEWEGNEGMAHWMNDNTLLFVSDRELNTYNLYRMDTKGGGRGAVRLTDFRDDGVQSFDVSVDGTKAVLHVWDRLYTLDLGGDHSQPIPLNITANEDEDDNYEVKDVTRAVSEAALSPDGKTMAVVAYGEIFVRHIDDKSPTRRVTHNAAREADLAWSPDGLKLYFASDIDGHYGIYAAAVALTRGEVKEEFENAVHPEKDKEQVEDEDAPLAEHEGDATESSQNAEAEDTDEHTDDDGAADKKDKDADDKKEELPKELQPDRWHDGIKFNIEPVVVDPVEDRLPSPSPDGKLLAFRRTRGDLMLLDLASGELRTLLSSWDFTLEWRWSPDSRHIAYTVNDMNYNQDIWIVPADGSTPAVNITRHPDDDSSPRFSADGKVLAFLSNRINDEYDVWMVYLDSDLESYTEQDLAKYYKDAVKAAKKRKPLKIEKPAEDKATADAGEEAPADDSNNNDKKPAEAKDKEAKAPEPLDLDNAWLRLRRVTSLVGSESNLDITPGGDRYIFSATIGDRGLYSVAWDGKKRKSLGGKASVQQVSLTGDKVVLVRGRQAVTVPPAGGKSKTVGIDADIVIDLEKQASQMFMEAARKLGDTFYHPTLKGLDWPAISEKYRQLAKRTRNSNEFQWVGMRFVGELNGSHLGFYPRPESSPNAQALGRLGTEQRRVDDGFAVTLVLPESPAASGPMALQVGDVITGIELQPFEDLDTVESRLKGRIDRETIVTIRRTMADGEEKMLNVLLTPISWGQYADLKYKYWRLENARRVAEMSGGRIGYIHIEAMSQPSLDVFERDLYAAANGRDGLIIDVRNNGGGWTADRLLASIMVRPHAYTVPRGADRSVTDAYPEDRLYIERFSLPIDMLCNQKSYSNAEIISHAFKTLERGTLVGEETHGSVISTGGMSLIDGTWVRLPFRGWYVIDGTDMEDGGAVPTLAVPQTPADEAAGKDPQLEAAVADLLSRL